MRTVGRFAFLSLFTLFLMIALAMPRAIASDPAPKFVQKASIGGQFEISSSQMALQKSQNDEVRSFAQQMIDDHTKASDQLKNLAAGQGMQPSSEDLDAKHSAMLAKLGRLKGAAFDKQYVRDQVAAHKEAVGLFKAYAQSGDNADLKGFAQTTLPVLESHQNRINQIKSSF